MVGQLAPARIDPATANRDLWNRFHELRRIRRKESRPDDPVQPDDEVEARMKKGNPFEFQHHYEISQDGVMLSSLYAETVTPSSPEYSTNKHLFWIDGYVRPDSRRKHIAALWLPVIAGLMDRHGCTVVGMSSDEESGHAFLEWLGAERKLTEIESRLRLSEVDWPMLERWTQEGAQRSVQTRLEIYDGRLPDAMLRDFAPQLTALLNTIPLESLDIGTIVVTPERIKDWYERQALSGEVMHTVLTREPEGLISGMTDISWAPYRRSLLYQQFTGVRPDARGRGLGKWIKAAMLLHIRETYPDAQWVVTDNAHSNGPMLTINRAIGFKPYRTRVEYQMTRQQLESRIRSLQDC
jgi:GNAT superfamily N-acetyltransferase